MSTVTEETAVVKSSSPVVKYDFNEVQIAEFAARAEAIDPASSPAAYEESRVILRTFVKARTSIEKQAKELNASALEWQRAVIAEKKRCIAIVEKPELPLAEKIKAVDDAKEAERVRKATEAREKIEAEARAKLDAERKLREEEEVKARAEQEAKDAERRAAEAKVAEENRIERERLAKIAAEQAAAQKKIDDDRADVEASKRKQEQADRERQIKIQAEHDAAERADKRRADDEKRRADEARIREEERQRSEAARPDVEKINALAAVFAAIALPEVTTPRAVTFLGRLRTDLTEIVRDCEAFRA